MGRPVTVEGYALQVPTAVAEAIAAGKLTIDGRKFTGSATKKAEKDSDPAESEA